MGVFSLSWVRGFVGGLGSWERMGVRGSLPTNLIVSYLMRCPTLPIFGSRSDRLLPDAV